MEHSAAASPTLSAPQRGRPRFMVAWDWTDVVLFFPIFLVADALLGAVISVAALANWGHSLIQGMTPEAQTATSSLFQETLVYLVAMGVLLSLVLGRRHSSPADLGWRLPRWWWIPAALVAAILSLLVVGAIGEVIHALFPQSQNGQVPSVQHQFGHLVYLAIPVVSLVAPVAEETFFRGFIYGWMRRHLNVPAAAILSGLVFGAVHGEIVILLPLAVLGVILALLYEYSRSLLPGVIVHAGFNLVNIVLILNP